jgi:NAD(P)-dependent dehydrogenase (short-subunit alcohol dehydrogenase family)
MIAYKPVTQAASLEGKTAVITGGASGIGLATAKDMAKCGARLVIADLNPEADDIAKSIGASHTGVTGDVRDANYRQSVISKAAETFSSPDILVNSAGIVALDSAEALSEEMWEQTISVNLTASFMMAQAFGKFLIGRGRPGSIVNIASQAGIVALDRHVAYCASKGGIISMTKVLALEWGKYGIRVNAVSPTVVLTELGHKAWNGPAGEALKKEIPAGRFAEPDEIAAAIAYLCGDSAAMITGHNLVIDGGYTIK